MFTIDFLEREHAEIAKVVDRVEGECIDIVNGKEINESFFRDIVKYIRIYADATHHKKEEDILFQYMVDQLGAVAEKLIRSGMLTEHQMARYYVMELEDHLNKFKESKSDKNKIQIISNAMSYVNLLRVHIEKENSVVYPFGEKNLSEEILNKIDEEMKSRIEIEESGEIERIELLKRIFD